MIDAGASLTQAAAIVAATASTAAASGAAWTALKVRQHDRVLFGSQEIQVPGLVQEVADIQDKVENKRRNS